ncbi:hypothetical protein ILUMI_23948 [Ignelater luminosus]|uniref:Uncharacterized protein n=1 Tax=Ignelater luminosus TaxID=2038154 RepID=A0A8K0FWR0_IGNLU|nr:hypothetical protein ILUMI_23948 [Ignelater luminosus]
MYYSIKKYQCHLKRFELRHQVNFKFILTATLQLTMGKHKEWRKLAKKARRKRIRQQLAKERCKNEESERRRREQSPSYAVWLEEQTKAEEFRLQEEARIAAEQEEQWLNREKEAQEAWLELQNKLKLVREERARQTARIREEWEREQNKLKEMKEKKEREEEEKRKEQEQLQIQIKDFVENGGEVPEGMKTKFETNPMKPTCPFFQKTGACRFKDTCSRNHIRPGISRVLIIPNFYSHYSLQQTENEHGSDFSLEFESQETYEHFKEFFYDVLPEIEKCGYVKQFKICCNHEPHLRGNAYIEYSSYREAVKGYQCFQGRWYGGKQLYVEFCSIESWKSAICGLFARQKCPKGTSCNFLHVFRNPHDLFAAADKDLHHTPPDSFEYESGESDARHWRWSESPERIPSSENQNPNHKRRSSRMRKRRSRESSHKSSRHSSHRSKQVSEHTEKEYSSKKSKKRQRSSSRSSSERHKSSNSSK